MNARKRFAQHFLEPVWVEKLLAALALQPDDWVIEIGPGRGALTRPLAAAVAKVLAIEIDRDLASGLKREAPANVSLLNADVLRLDLAETIRQWTAGASGLSRQLRVVGNLPYNISSPILFRLLEIASTVGIHDATLMLQKEVADRLVAQVGTSEYGVLTILTALRADVSRLLALPPGAFRPAPKVHSAVVRLTFRPAPVAIGDEPHLVRMVRSIFTQRRKTLNNALRPFARETNVEPVEALDTAGLDGQRRPETLTLADAAALSEAMRTARS